jgi:hypothetical protein
VTLAGFFWSRHELPDPRPGYWSKFYSKYPDDILGTHRMLDGT